MFVLLLHRGILPVFLYHHGLFAAQRGLIRAGVHLVQPTTSNLPQHVLVDVQRQTHFGPELSLLAAVLFFVLHH